MILNVTQSASGRPGSVSTSRQLSKPDGRMSPIPSQVVKLRPSTPISGITAKVRNMSSAGRTIQAIEPCRTACDAVRTGATRSGGT